MPARLILGIVGALLLAASPAAADAFADIVTTGLGRVRGVTVDGVTSFKGIPYAAPPIGSYRWRAPQPARPWSDVLFADRFGPACMQANDAPQSEDCLTLNVWRPAAASAPLPVMVWIHGGGLVQGSGAADPGDALARQGVIVVSMNYRLGRLGFFAHPALAREAPDDVRGNYGYMDQRAALEWIKHNIAAFGGDPGAVTIFGESAGGGSVLVHLTSPLSRGLFHRAILQSPGHPTARARVLPLTELAEAEKTALDFAHAIGVTDDGAAGLAALRAWPAEKLLDGATSAQELSAQSAGKLIAGLAGAIRDGRLVVDAPEAVLAAGRQAMVPVMVGADDRDLGIGNADSKEALFAPFGAQAAEARTVYDRRGDQTLAELKQRVLADESMVEPARHLADAMARAGQPVFLYRFAYVSEALRGKVMGTPHSYEIPFTLNLPGRLVNGNATPTDKAMADLVSGYWVRFGQTGDPNGGGSPPWPRHDPAVDRILHVTNSGIIVGSDPLKPRLDLWTRRWEPAAAAGASQPAGGQVTPDNFVAAETDLYFAGSAKQGAFGKLQHRRMPASIDQQDVVRMNRDTLYSAGVFDLDAAPLVVTLPDAGKRFMSMQAISQDHYTVGVAYAPGRHSFTRDSVGTRYVFIIVRTFADPRDADDLTAANALQDAIRVEQAAVGRFEVPAWDRASQDKVRTALKELATLRGRDSAEMFGARGGVDPVAHLIGTAVGWGGNPPSAAVYQGVYPKENDGTVRYQLTVRDVPVDGFWSLSVYNAEGYFEKNPLGAYSVNDITAKRDADGSVTVRFGGCTGETPNCLPITPGWNYTVRLYRPRPEVVSGDWTFPAAQPVK